MKLPLREETEDLRVMGTHYFFKEESHQFSPN